MIYVCAGLYAEGPSDYKFLCPLIDRLLDVVLAANAPSRYEVAPTVGVDAPAGRDYAGRAERLTAAIGEFWETCNLFVVHVDGAGNPAGLRQTCVDEPVSVAQSARPGEPIVSAACVPVREVEAWMLVDPRPFTLFLGKRAEPALPPRPESEIDPKATLRGVLAACGARKPHAVPFELLGQNVALDALERLPSFQSFRRELEAAVSTVVRRQRSGGP